MGLPSRYKWVALSNTTIAVLIATIDSSIMLIAMPSIFRGIRLNPLEPHNTFYLLWMILGFQIVSSIICHHDENQRRNRRRYRRGDQCL